MKIFLFFTVCIISISCKSQNIYPLGTHTVPAGSYVKDLNNELLPYEGIWKGTWDNKVLYITFKRIKKLQDHRPNHPYYKDVLIAKFKVLTSDEVLTIYDNTTVADDNTKIEGTRFFTMPILRYSLIYIDPEICRDGTIRINFINTAQTQLNWKYIDTTDMLTSDCPYYNTPDPLPQALPAEIILTKQ